jgi:hypothetical protein
MWRRCVGDYGNFKWRVLTYPDFAVNFIFKESRWQYDFASDTRGRVLPDAKLVPKPATIKLPCER